MNCHCCVALYTVALHYTLLRCIIHCCVALYTVALIRGRDGEGRHLRQRQHIDSESDADVGNRASVVAGIGYYSVFRKRFVRVQHGPRVHVDK